MEISVVNSEQDKKDFLLLPLEMYKGDPNFIRPLDKDVLNIFNPKRNKNCKEDNHIRHLLKNDDGRIIGRVAAFINPRVIKNGEKEGGLGFFECIDNQDAANMLFNACRDWLGEKGMELMDGPINLGERERWWG
ncbi:MAG: hypothetical protein RIC15_02045, partial [Vicingaceae bacterium]